MKLTGVALSLALAACSKSATKTDLSKMSSEEACRTVVKRTIECKDTIVPAVSAAMKKAGADDGTIAKMTGMIAEPRSCSGVSAEDIDPMLSCYDDDCSKLAQCYVGMMAEAMRPAGGSKAVDPGPASASSVTAP
jgi:hypothetical protein